MSILYTNCFDRYLTKTVVFSVYKNLDLNNNLFDCKEQRAPLVSTVGLF